MLDPMNLTNARIPYGYVDESHQLLMLDATTYMAYSGPDYLSIHTWPTLLNMSNEVSSRRLSFTFPASELIDAGIESDSGFGLFAVATDGGSSDYQGWSGTQIWDTAGVGAAAAPEQFENQYDVPLESEDWMAILIMVLIFVIVISVVYSRRQRSRTRPADGELPSSMAPEGRSRTREVVEELPGTPEELTVEIADGIVELRWRPPGGEDGDGVYAYRIYRGLKDPHELHRIADVDAGTRSYTDSTGTRGLTYYYRISALGPAGEGDRTYVVRADL
jgi:hypothetical protein